MKKGFTLIELLVLISIIGILASVVIASLNSARNKLRQSEEAKKQEVTESVVDKFTRDDTYEIKSYDKEPTDAEVCGEIPDADVRSECLRERYSDRMIQNCVERYSNYDN